MVPYKSFDNLRKIVATLKNKINRKEVIDECCNYIDNNTILVKNDLFEKNVIYGLRDNTTIEFNNTSDNTLYIFNSNTQNVLIDGVSIELVKNAVNVLTNTYVKDQWFTTVVSYNKSLLKDCIVNYNANSVASSRLNSTDIKIVPDLSGNGYNVNRTYDIETLGKQLTSSMTKDSITYHSAIIFDVLGNDSTSYSGAIKTLDKLDMTKDFTILMAGNASPINNADTKFFQLGNNSETTINEGLIAKISGDNNTITFSILVDGVEKTVSFPKNKEGLGNTITIEYLANINRLSIQNMSGEGGVIENVTFTNNDNVLALGNSFAKEDRAYYLCRYFIMWNRLLEENEHEIIAKEIGDVY